MVLYNKEVAGYVCIYPYSTNGILGEEGFSEIADFGILEKYKDLGIEKNYWILQNRLHQNIQILSNCVKEAP